MEKLLNTNELASALGRSRSYVAAMKKSGYLFSHGMRTTLSHAIAWLGKRPDFKSTGYYQSSAKHDRSPDLSVAGRFCEQ